MRIFLLLTLIACGSHPVLLIASVDEALAPAFDKLSMELPGYFVRDPNGIQIKVGDVIAVAEESAYGVWDSGTRTITIIPPNTWVKVNNYEILLSSETVKFVLAHELGHAFGLRHTAAGLMAAEPDIRCFGHEADCLLIALEDLH